MIPWNHLGDSSLEVSMGFVGLDCIDMSWLLFLSAGHRRKRTVNNADHMLMAVSSR